MFDCTCLVPVQDQTTQQVETTVDSLVNFAALASEAFGLKMHITCACCRADKEGEIQPVLNTWRIPLVFGLEEYPSGCEVLDLVDNAWKTNPAFVYLLIEPGKRIRQEAYGTLATSIQAVRKDEGLLVLSHDGKSKNHAPSCLYSKLAYLTCGIGKTAVDGYSVVCRKRWRGGVEFERKQPTQRTVYDVPWLISAFAFEFHRAPEHADLRIAFHEWI